MSRPGNNHNETNKPSINKNVLWGAAGVAIAAAAAGGLSYWLTKPNSRTEHADSTAPARQEERHQSFGARKKTSDSRSEPPFSYLRSFLSSVSNFLPAAVMSSPPEYNTAPVPRRPEVSNLNSLLHDIYVRYIQLKNEDRIYYSVFCEVFRQLQEHMKDVDAYYNKYSSRKQFAGSHYQGLRIKKPDEFDMDIVIGLPLNFDVDPINPSESDILIENKAPGFVQLKMGKQFQALYKRDGEEFLINKTAFEWGDEKGYLLRSKFTDWFNSVVYRALNKLPTDGSGKRTMVVHGRTYKLSTSSSGPALTFYIEAPGFKLDVDFVPALKFPEKRWPICKGYRPVPLGCSREDFIVVPKPNKEASLKVDQNRSWRLALHDQEKQMMKGSNNLKMVVKLLKQLRDAQEMKKISSYYLNTVFFWEIEKQKYTPDYWSKNSLATLFTDMVCKLADHIKKGEIPYYWNSSNNLIGAVPKSVLNTYQAKIDKLVLVLKNEPNNYRAVAKFLIDRADYPAYESILNGC